MVKIKVYFVCQNWQIALSFITSRLAGYGFRQQDRIVSQFTGEYTERERPLCPKAVFPQNVHVSDTLSGSQTSRVKFTPAPLIELHVRQQRHTPFAENKVGGESGQKEASLQGTEEHSDAPQSSTACECRGPLPELYEYEPLSVKAEAVRLM